MSSRMANINQYIVLVASLLLLCLGVAMLTHIVSTDTATLWLPSMLVLGGLFLIPGGSSSSKDTQANTPTNSPAFLVAISLVLVGGVLLLRDLGIIEIPILRYLLGGGLCVIGLAGIVRSSIHIMRSVAV